MRTKTEQEAGDGAEMRAIATTVRELQARAKKANESTLAYLLDIAALEAEARSRRLSTPEEDI